MTMARVRPRCPLAWFAAALLAATTPLISTAQEAARPAAAADPTKPSHEDEPQPQGGVAGPIGRALGLPPTPWLFELNGGLPGIDVANQKFVADGSFGYATSHFGVVARGYVNTYDVRSSSIHDDYLHSGGALEGYWLSGGAESMIRVEIRASVGVDYYDTTSFPKESALSAFVDYDSRMGRAALLLGLRHGAPGDRFWIEALAGGGGQYEDPDTLRINASGLQLSSTQSVTAHGLGRLRLRWQMAPEIVSLRAKLDAAYFRRSRDEVAVVAHAGVLQASITSGVQGQTELHARLALDADIASVLGFVPAIFGGVDVLSIGGDREAASMVAPVLGAGIVRNSW
jgi:hypothetical protein